MKYLFTLVVLLLIRPSAIGAEVLELRGIVASGGVTKFAVVDKSNETTKWVTIGQTFAGYKVAGFDPATDTLTVTKDSSQLRLRLVGARIKEGPAILAMPVLTTTGSFVQGIAGPGVPPEVAQAIRNNLRQIAAAADQYYLEYGKNTVALSELVGPTKYIKQLNPVDGESYAGMQLKSGTPISVTTARGGSVMYAP
jgi:hypothetical protein